MRSRYFVISFVLLGMIFAPASNNLFSDEEIMLTSGRSGPDAEVGDILSPRATTTDSITGEKLHTLKAGDDVHFEAYIENVGDSAITEMGITVTVYLSHGGARGNIAMDAAGNELSWTNGDVVCDDSFVCPWSSLGAGVLLDSGKYTITYQGSPVTWTPMVGEYIVVVQTDAVGDADPSNDDYENLVSVVDWTDIIVDLAWDSGKEIEGGSGDKAFTLTVETGGSSSWSAHGIQLELVVEGTLLTAVDNDGTDIMGTNIIGDNSSATSGFGTYGNTITWMHQDDANNTTSGERHVIDFQDSFEWYGVVSPDTSGSSGDYSISVSMVSYVIFGQLPECEETTTPASGSGEEPQTFIHYCEVEMTQDDDAATSEDMIEGKVQTFHDIGVTSLIINQGYTMDGNLVESGPDNPGLTEGPLNPAWSNIQASVRHLGSDIMVTYDWEVSFEIENIISGAVHTEVADMCHDGLGDPYDHHELGESWVAASAFETGEACIMFNFAPGIYDITATVSMVGGAVGTEDMSTGNDDSSIFEIYAMNNRPSVTLSLMEQQDSIVIGPEGYITLIADAYDADDWSGQSLYYVWTHPAMDSINGTLQPSICNGIGPAFATCQLTAFDSAWAGTNLYSVRVSDEHGSYAQDSISITVPSGEDQFTPMAFAEIDMRPVYADQIIDEGTKTVSGEDWPLKKIVLDDTGSVTIHFDAGNSSDADAVTGNGIQSYEWRVLFDKPYGEDNYKLEGHTFSTPESSDGKWAYTFSNVTVSPNGQTVGQIRIELIVIDQAGKLSDKYKMYFSVVPEGDGDAEPEIQLDLSLNGTVYYGDTITLAGNVLGGAENSDVYVEVALLESTLYGSPISKYAAQIEGEWAKSTALGDGDSFELNLTLSDDTSDSIQRIYLMTYEGDDKRWTTIYWIEIIVIQIQPDQDGDGVSDNLDNCPQTISGYEVDSNGCATDRDQDGITNSFDDCPDDYGTSSKGQHSNRLIGCPDSDGDGWANAIDAFPEDSSEWLDSDGDGCGDNSDAFPQDPDECIDTDEDGYGDNSDLFPEDAMEFEDKDGDGVGDNSDKCDTTTTGTDIDSSGCEIQDETSTLVIGLVSGVGGLLLVIIVLLVVIKRGSSKQDSNDNSVNPEKRSFNETNYGFSNQVTPVTPMMNNYNQQQFSAPAMSPMPTISDMGEVSSDGYEWLEYPAGSNEWYWRANPGTQWTKHQ